MSTNHQNDNSTEPRLGRGLGKVFGFLKKQNEGDIVTAKAIMAATGWKESSLTTYLRKNKLAGFLAKRADGRFEVLRNGSTLLEEDIAGALTQVTPDATRFAPKERIASSNSEYELVKELGRGATAHVWQARERSTGDEVAIKIVNPRPDLLDPSIFSGLQRRFRREAMNGGALESQYVIRHLDYGTHRGLQFLVMELAEHSAKEALEKSGAMALRDAEEIIVRCVLALHDVHATGSIHRDVKPANILLVERGAVLGDLGIVKWSDVSAQFMSAGTITTASVLLGSLNYMAPEQRDAPSAISPASDIYSLGVTWYELLSNDRPSPQAFVAKKTRPPCKNPFVTDLIGRMTSYDPADRPTIAELIRLLRIPPPPELRARSA